MRIGPMRHAVRLQSRGIGADTRGQAVQQWADYATVFAAVEPMSGRQYIVAGRQAADVSTVVKIRYRPGVNVKDRVIFRDHFVVPARDRVFEVDAVMNVNERNRETHLMCREVIE